jgi:hypothetical protein
MTAPFDAKVEITEGIIRDVTVRDDVPSAAGVAQIVLRGVPSYFWDWIFPEKWENAAYFHGKRARLHWWRKRNGHAEIVDAYVFDEHDPDADEDGWVWVG